MIHLQGGQTSIHNSWMKKTGIGRAVDFDGCSRPPRPTFFSSSRAFRKEMTFCPERRVRRSLLYFVFRNLPFRSAGKAQDERSTRAKSSILECEIKRSVEVQVLSFRPSPQSKSSENRFVSAVYSGWLIPFGSQFPEASKRRVPNQ
jgi:hypothetical protein